MAIDRSEWPEWFASDSPPDFPCPRCKKGRLVARKPLTGIEPQYSRLSRQADEWERDWLVERYSIQFICNHSSCGEVAIAACDSVVEEVPNDDYEWNYETCIRIRSLFPAPNIFPIPEGVPKSVIEPLEYAFGHFWNDRAACVNRIGASVESLLNYWKIPKFRKNKSKSKREFLPLHRRIEIAEERCNCDGNLLKAIKWVRNAGSHGSAGVISREVVFEILEIFETVLRREFEEKLHGKRIERAANKINSKKGRVSVSKRRPVRFRI